MGATQVVFFVRVETPTNSLWHVLVSVMVFTFWLCCKPFEYTLGRHKCLLVVVHDPCQECMEWLTHPLLQVEGAWCYLFNSPQPIFPYWRAYSFRGSTESHPIPPSSQYGWEGSSFLGSAPPSDIINSESVVSIKPGDSSVVIRYQVDEFTCTWLVEYFFAQSHIYLCFMGQVPTLTDSPL